MFKQNKPDPTVCTNCLLTLVYLLCLPAECSHCIQDKKWSSASLSSPAWREQKCCRPACCWKTSAPQSEASNLSLSTKLKALFQIFCDIYHYCCPNTQPSSCFSNVVNDMNVNINSIYLFKYLFFSLKKNLKVTWKTAKNNNNFIVLFLLLLFFYYYNLN